MNTSEDVKAGPEFDALVAERVMGWTRDNDGWSDNGVYLRHFGQFRPSTSIADAWEVLLHLEGSARRVESLVVWVDDNLGGHHEREWYCRIGTGVGRADTAPLAICIAALSTMTPTTKEQA